MNLGMLLMRAGRSFPERAAVVLGDRVWTAYGDLAARVGVLAAAFRDRFGLVPGDRIGLFMTNCPHFVEVFQAALHGGHVTLPINNKLHDKELAYILGDAGAALVVVTEDLAESAAKAVAATGADTPILVVGSKEYAALLAGEAIPMVERAPRDLAWLFYTSGTTGNPKGAMLSHRSLWDMVLTYFVDIDDVPANGHAVHAAPMSHGSGFYGLPHLARGAAQVVPESGHFEPAEICALIESLPEVSMFAAPTMVKRLVDHPDDRDTANLRTITYGGGPMYVADAQKAFARLGPKLVQIYGQGESPMTITVLPRGDIADTGHPRYEARLASVGYAQSVCEVRVADADDNTLPAGEVGEVLVRGDVVMEGYWNKPDETTAALRGGWLHTGDMGAFDEDGYLTLKDRSKDLIISGGSNIYPREIEEVLLRHPDVAEVAVVGRPHPEWGEEVVAFVAPVEGREVDIEALDRLCLDNIARFKRPKQWRVAASLPKNNYGKIVKRELRGWLEGEGDTAGG
jgi:long-chain acyl-CoA synthetase